MHSVPFLCCSFCFHCLTYRGKSLHLTASISLDRYRSALQVNFNARSGFQAFAAKQPNDDKPQQKKCSEIYFQVLHLPLSYRSSYKHSSSEGITNAELGWGDAGKLYFQAVFLVSPIILLVDLKQANCIPFPISPPNSQGGESLPQSILRPTKDKHNVRSWYYYSFCSSCLLQEIPQRSDI